MTVSMLLLLICLFVIIGSSYSKQQNNNSTNIAYGNHTNSNYYRRLSEKTIPAGKGPELFLIGAPKCGTTSLAMLLHRHSEICPSIKEIHFFDHAYEKGPNFYLKNFISSKCKKNMKKIDATPIYVLNKLVPSRIIEMYDKYDLLKLKFLVILRDPVARAFSWYNHLVSHCVPFMSAYMKTNSKKYDKVRGWNTNGLCGEGHCHPLECSKKGQFISPQNVLDGVLTFREYYENGNVIIEHGMYLRAINRWLEFFNRKQLMIINMGTLLENTTDTVNRIASFYGLSHGFGSKVILPVVNTPKFSTDFDCSVRSKLYPQFRAANKALYEFMRAGGGPDQEPPFPDFKVSKCD